MKTIPAIKILFFSVLGAFLAGCGPTPTDVARPIEVSVIQEWTPNSNYCGAVFGAREFASRHNLVLKIREGSDSIDPIKLVLAGESQFGDAAADKVVAAIAKGADLQIIGVLNNDSPTCFIAKKDAHIQTPLDFVGKKVGVLTGTSTEYVYRSLLSKLKIDKSQLTEIEAPFDLGTFIAGEYDVRPAFVYDEPVSLDLQKIRYDIIDPRIYGVGFLGTVYFTTGKYARDHPEIVQSFIDTVADGWRASISHPETAIEHLAQSYPTIDLKREKIALEKSLPYFAGTDGKPLTLNSDSWDSMVSSLKQLGVIPQAKAFPAPTLDYVSSYYARQQR